jgi:hypothetical protein
MARWRGGRCCRAARNASSIVSREMALASGSVSLAAAGSSQQSGYGCNQGSSGAQDGAARASDASVAAMTGGAMSCGRTRRGARSSTLRQALVAMRYSQVRNSARPAKLSRPRQARSSVS